MAKSAQHHEFYVLLRRRGLRKKVAKTVANLEGNSRRAGVEGEAVAEKAVVDLTAAVDEIGRRVLRTDARRSRGARKAAQTRSRQAAKRSSSAKQAAKTRAKVARARTPARQARR